MARKAKKAKTRKLTVKQVNRASAKFAKLTANEKRALTINVREAEQAMRRAIDSSHAANLNRFRDRVHRAAKANGWWDLHRDVGTLLMLTVSEIAEAMEGFRKDLMDDKLPDHKMFDVEICDGIIRLFDLAGHMGIDVGGICIKKLAYNAQRNDVPKRQKGKNRNRF